MDTKILQMGVTHPTIHGDYYDWLNTIQEGTFNDNFRKKYCPAFSDFHAIAMWVWSQSREQLKRKAETPVQAVPLSEVEKCPDCGHKISSCHLGSFCTNPKCDYID